MPDGQDSKPMNRDARSGSFPESLPTSLSDRRSICENDWSAFRNIEYTVDHWSRNEWPSGREVFYWYLTFRNSELINLAQLCQNSLNSDGFDLVPLDRLHITILRIGNYDEISQEDIQAIADSAKVGLSDIDSFDLTVGPLAGSRGAVRFTVSPWKELFQLHRILGAATRKVLPDLPIASTQRFRPHLGIGYSNRQQEAASLIEQVASLRDATPVTVQVEAVKLVRLRRELHAYHWEDVATLALKPS
ncbi:2'-5' RNA ligase family protein [Nocardia tengchongensis]|uniref:2'-5' RNA ligase family protein n=1 Tax=Nocardia tengchongensis TaxID=2055889 RepID=A0ABX8CW49_9NOCA|nr:2'-5' RNA ligase family protein [Nocardia tengchongensis]QVI24124.1 2'-5' RNA ligase family protein [Nocardia tengchongensis]